MKKKIFHVFLYINNGQSVRYIYLSRSLTCIPVTELVRETGMCIADQPPTHGDHDLFALIVAMTT